MACIYTKTELITKIQAIDTKLEESIQMSRLDSGQGVSTYQVTVEILEKQRNRYYQMCMQYYPDDYSGILKIIPGCV